jgi:hypothetical protein
MAGSTRSRARNSKRAWPIAFEVVTDRGEPPVANTNPRVATGSARGGRRGRGGHDHRRRHIDEQQGRPGQVWVDTDAAPLQAVGNFMDEAGGASGLGPGGPGVRDDAAREGRYVFDTTCSRRRAGTRSSQLRRGLGGPGRDGRVQRRRGCARLQHNRTGQRVRLFVDVREQHLDAWVGACDLDRNDDQRLDFMDTLAFLREVDGGSPAADRTGDGLVDTDDIYAFLTALANGCGQADP